MSENSNMVEQLAKCMNDVLSKNSLDKTKKMLGKIRLLLNIVCVDKKLLNKISKTKSKNAFANTMLGVLGLNLTLESDKRKLTEKIEQQAAYNKQLRKKYRNLKNQYILDRDMYLISMQRLLEEITPNPVQKESLKLESIIKQSLEQFGVEVIWDIPDLDNGKMFSIYKTELNHEKMVQQPCFMGKDGVILKGLGYQKVEMI